MKFKNNKNRKQHSILFTIDKFLLGERKCSRKKKQEDHSSNIGK